MTCALALSGVAVILLVGYFIIFEFCLLWQRFGLEESIWYHYQMHQRNCPLCFRLCLPFAQILFMTKTFC